ncbi:MAG: hypothetical protein JSS82_04695 [Bacteroidetes bacterium]|nr:hypothetical protein [Bacteroidota bacterium]
MGRYLFFLLICCSLEGYCQSKCDCFDRLYNLSLNQTDEQRSVDILKDAISFLEPDQKGEYYWEIASSYKRLKQYDSSAAWYQKAIDWGYDLSSLIWNAPEVYNRMDTNKLNTIAREHGRKADPVLYRQFMNQLKMDQVVRSGEIATAPENGDEPMVIHNDSIKQRLIEKVDDSTARFVKWVLDKYGFPTYRQLNFYPRGFWVEILHVTAHRNANAARVLTKLTALSDECRFRKSQVLFLKDRQKYYNDKKSYCGLTGPGDRYLYIEDISKADSIRLANNHVRLKEEATSWNGKLPPGYKPRPYPKNYFCLKKYNID